MHIPKSADWEVHASFFCLDNFWEFREMEVLLDALERDAAPEFWGEGGIVGSRYERPKIQAYFADHADPGEGRPPLVLKRSSQPRYVARVNVGNTVHPHSIHLTSDYRHGENEIESLFGVADVLASRLRLDFATIDLARLGQAESRMVIGATTEHLGAYIHGGPHAIWVRTYIGPRVVQLGGGMERWTSCGGLWRTLSNGTLALELDRTAWRREPEELKAVQVDLLPRLIQSTGVFRIDGDVSSKTVAGPRWQAPPGASWPR